MIKLKGIDIGEVEIKGSLITTEEGYVVTGSGKDIWENKDQAYFSYLEQNEDFDFSVKITSLTMPHLYTKAGIMARDTSDDDSKHVYWMVFGSNEQRNNNIGGYEFQFRDQKGGDSVAIYPAKSDSPNPEFPVNYPNTWLRLQRISNEFVAYYSEDGNGWKEYGRHTSTLNSKLMIGICVTSHSEKEMVECVFTEVSI